MEAKVEMITKEMIKPSFPTPPPLKTHKLSLLDQISPLCSIPLIFFYHGNTSVQLLKQSLSNALTRYYPLAGRLNVEDSSVDCNDAGAEFIEAQVHGYSLSQVIESPKMEELREFLRIEACGILQNDVVLRIQANTFDCGGIAIGVAMSHTVGDSMSLVTFINSWAAIARTGDSARIVQPNFNLASDLFPPINLPYCSNPSIGIMSEKVVTRRFVFGKEKLDALKRLGSESRVEDPTRVEALSAFMWKHMMEASKLKNNCKNKKVFGALHAVNIRPRMNNPSLPDHSFGNLWAVVVALLTDPTTEYDLVYQLRRAIREINSDYINEKLKNGEEILERMSKMKELFTNGEIEILGFSSCCRFPVYEADFGWGKPDWVGIVTMPCENVIILLSTKCGEGIEAWVNMLEEEDGNLFEASIYAST